VNLVNSVKPLRVFCSSGEPVLSAGFYGLFTWREGTSNRTSMLSVRAWPRFRFGRLTCPAGQRWVTGQDVSRTAVCRELRDWLFGWKGCYHQELRPARTAPAGVQQPTFNPSPQQKSPLSETVPRAARCGKCLRGNRILTKRVSRNLDTGRWGNTTDG
jgi:hypothetical protein